MALLFGGAGTLRWPAGWIYLVLFFGGAVWLTIGLARSDPALLAERMKSPGQKSQPFWDKVLLLTMAASWCCWMALMGVDAVRFRWSAMPVWLQCAGGLGLVWSFPHDRPGVPREYVSGAGGEDSKRTGASRGVHRSLRDCASPAVRGSADLSAGQRVAARLLVWRGRLGRADRRPDLSHHNGRSGITERGCQATRNMPPASVIA